MKKLTIICIAVATIGLQGCAGTETRADVDRTLSGIAYKTFPSDVESVRMAAKDTFREMGMDLKKEERTEDGYAIHAAARERIAEVELNSFAETATQMRVMVTESEGDFGDGITSTDIIIQTSRNIVSRVAQQ